MNNSAVRERVCAMRHLPRARVSKERIHCLAHKCIHTSVQLLCIALVVVKSVKLARAAMPWFGGTRQSLKMGSGRSGVYWVADDRGERKPKSRKRRGSTGRLGDGGSGAGSPPPPPPAGILKRSGRGLRGSQPSFQFEEGMVPEEMAAAVPMPSEQSVNAMFSEMVVGSFLIMQPV